jgi:hypothetical protein
MVVSPYAADSGSKKELNLVMFQLNRSCIVRLSDAKPAITQAQDHPRPAAVSRRQSSLTEADLAASRKGGRGLLFATTRTA